VAMVDRRSGSCVISHDGAGEMSRVVAARSASVGAYNKSLRSDAQRRRRQSRVDQDSLYEAMRIICHTAMGIDVASWWAELASQLANLAKTSCEVHAVLARHSWSNGCFQQCPNRGLLLRDLRLKHSGTSFGKACADPWRSSSCSAVCRSGAASSQS